MVQDRAMLTTADHCNSNSYMIYRTAPYSATFNDPFPDFKVTLLFGAK